MLAASRCPKWARREGRAVSVHPWNEPTVRWQAAIDSVAHHERLTGEGELLATWPPAPFETSATDCFRVAEEYWIWQPGVGGLRFRRTLPECDAFPAVDVDRVWFERVVTRSWLPAVYQLWGRQVLHASAVCWNETGAVVAFAGPSQAGKSTFAYGLGKRPGWSLICDDTLAFSFNHHPVAQLTLHPLQNDARLRPASARYYGTDFPPSDVVRWPARPMTLRRVYFLTGDEAEPRAVAISPLNAADSYRRFLEQAHALTLKIPQHNQRLMTDYLELASRIPAFRLIYRKSFDVIEEVLDAIEQHELTPASSPVLG